MTNSESGAFGRADLLAAISKLQAALADAERSARAKSLSWAAAAHDLRQPAQTLVLLTAIAERQTASVPEAAKTIAAIKSAVAALQAMLASLDAPHTDAWPAPAMQSVDLALVLERLAAEYAPRAEARNLKLRAPCQPLCVRADPDLLARAVRNLLENALRYTRSGGVLLCARRRGASARIDIIDTGIGIAPEHHAVIFHAYHQLAPASARQGSGLGLAVVAELAKRIGATVELSSKTARGSRFSLLLPLAVAPADSAAPEG